VDVGHHPIDMILFSMTTSLVAAALFRCMMASVSPYIQRTTIKFVADQIYMRIYIDRYIP
jgi:hypothetical protein